RRRARGTPHDVIAPPGGRAGARGLRPGPKALAKWLAGSVRKDPADMIAAAFDEAEARDPLHLRTWVVLVGGAGHQLSLIRAEAARRGVTIHIVSGLRPVLAYLWGGAWSTHPAGAPPPSTGSRPGHSRSWPAAATAPPPRSPPEPTRPACTQAGAPGADACVRYLGNKREFLR